jgi:hypothetical protein
VNELPAPTDLVASRELALRGQNKATSLARIPRDEAIVRLMAETCVP